MLRQKGADGGGFFPQVWGDREVFAKAGASERYDSTFHPGPHKFDINMQEEAFDWFDRWLKS